VETAENLVAMAFQSLGYFVMTGVTSGLREADLLAVRLDEHGHVAERVHCEVSVSLRPIGVIRPRSRLGQSAHAPEESAGQYIDKKFFDPSIVSAIQSRLGGQATRRVFVHGRLKAASQLEVFHARGIETWAIGSLVEEALRSAPTRDLDRMLGITELLKIRSPEPQDTARRG